jgi:hypothetical protein
MKNLFKKIAILSVAIMVFGCSKDDDSSSTPVEVVKTKVKLTRIEVPSYPSKAWDIGSLPDFFALILNENNQLISTSTTDWNINPSTSYPFFVSYNNPLQITNLSSGVLKIGFFDNDSDDPLAGDDDFIGTVVFNISDYTSGTDKYPTTITKTQNSVTCKLFLTWE